ncbi:cytochrome c oxidase subunit II [Dolichospermum sp. ST_sed1]|nr:cytochrome c oxidase subunit II [Dolichospermum sp. ST_sed1]MDD1425039.1 cytochrome c oxidase subunit II [Dolichospermum sp. ST_sed9]MDD1432866.1 cytochrome c oxidase subunit II [Dolichospermum sp. ST_sed6]MDD1437821.1 cytochrome c oxidase subunit II [Dolichospermum sp. ST_sed10]MDD1442268.1 cytochrome c oxidase subunit II [Dolichospermum sp. ST_sed3]MDD1445286.1 cytochrome c oxidase subunit II [Dolichospermum sp. ST_sed8]MDD1456280.1 cytochrome c oxidase subunit II [Dolichospermum sp. ST_
MKIPNAIWTLLIGIVLTLISLWYGQNNDLLPVAATDEAPLIDGLFNTMMTVSTGIFLIVEGVLIYAVIRYRRRAGDNEDGPPVEGNVPLEILWTAIPAIIVIGISIYSFDVYNNIGGFDPHSAHAAPMMEDAMNMPGTAMAATLINADASPQVSQLDSNSDAVSKPAELIINVTGMQYAWIFNYPDTDLTTGELHVPIGKKVEINMTANDVIHAFWVPEFRIKQDAIPGRRTNLSFTPRKAGDYQLICAELCGPYHGVMKSQVVVETQEAFDSWMQEQLLASKDMPNQTVAMNSMTMTADEFLSPYTKDIGIHPEILHQIK